MTDIEIIKKWADLRNPMPNTKDFEATAILLYGTLSDSEKIMMMKECTNYIDGVEKGVILPTIPELKIPKYKKSNLRKLN